MEKSLLQTILFLAALLTSARCELTSTNISSDSTSESSTADNKMTSVFTSGSTPEITSELSFTDDRTVMASSTHASIVVSSTLVDHSSSSVTSAAPTTSSSPSNATFRLSYRYAVRSSSPLKLENITNSTVLASVQVMVASSFNLSNFSITVERIEITSRTKDTPSENDMLTHNVFQTHRKDCDVACVKASALPSATSNQSFTLPDVNGSLVNVIATSGPLLCEDMSRTTSAPINYKKGERPPGAGARLGMGLSIPIITVLLMAEIVYFYRKYRNNSPLRGSNYEIATYTSPPAI